MLCQSLKGESTGKKVAGLTPGSNCTISYLYKKLCEIKGRMFYVLLGTFVLLSFCFWIKYIKLKPTYYTYRKLHISIYKYLHMYI